MRTFLMDIIAIARMETEVQRQQELMRALRAFVDALRDIKKEEQIDVDVEAAIRSLCSSGTPDADAEQQQQREADRERVWRSGLVPALQQLSACMQRIDQLEVQRSCARVHE